MNFLTRDDLTEKLNNLGSAITEQATVLNLYPIFRRATSSGPDPTPGYIYDVLIEFSFKNNKNSILLGEYMNKRLQRHSVHGVLKTLKCISQLVAKGSRNFRIYLRANDEHIKNSQEFGSQQGTFRGTAVLEEIRKLTEQILKDLFDQASIDRDSSNEPERPPSMVQSLTGMGRSDGSTIQPQASGKYAGFGNSPIDKGGVTDTLRSVLDQLLYAPDPRQERLEACLRGTRGQYQAAKVDLVVPGREAVDNGTPVHTPKPHIPGRPGGGWEDDEDSEDEFVEFGGLCLDPSASAGGGGGDGSITGTEECSRIQQFCAEDSTQVSIDSLIFLVDSLQSSGERLNVLYSLKHVLETEADTGVFKALLVLEKVLERGLLPPAVVSGVLRPNLDARRTDQHTGVALKSAKILAILDFLKDYKRAQ